MSATKQAARPLLQSVRYQSRDVSNVAIRAFSSSGSTQQEAVEQQAASQSTLPFVDPNYAHTPRLERKVLESLKTTPVGSRRRRAALRSSSNIPFEQLPYQCFQEARKILAADREEKIKQIEQQRARIERLKAKQVEPQDELQKERRLRSMQMNLEELKIFADINDPVVKKRFEDNLGDMNKPIYRHLADREWRKYDRNLLVQRITQMNVIPDVLPSLDPVVNVELSFGRRKVQPGEFIDSRVSEIPATLKIQPYDKGERYISVAVVNADVPNVEKDGFDYRCHFLACNIRVSPTQTSVPLQKLLESQVVVPWLPAYTQKGAPYQRMSVFVMQQAEGQELDVAALKERTKQDGFILRSFVDRNALKPVGVNLFRSKYDEGTAGVMQRAGIPGHDVEFKRKKIEPLPYKKLPGSRYR